MPTKTTSSASQQIITALAENTVQLTELKHSLQALSDSVARVTGLADEIQRTLRGSNGSSGLVGRIEALERFEDDCNVERLTRVIDGDEKGSGLLERMRKCERFQERIEKWGYLVMSALAIDVVLRLWPELVKLIP